jgi:hypothetical protein
MTPAELKDELRQLIKSGIQDPCLIIGESGIGKTSIVGQVCAEVDSRVWDVRWGQLMPADARGVPVPQHPTKEDFEAGIRIGMTVFYPPSFWPRKGPGVIFLDEFNLATAAMMGLGQQLLLDRRFGDYFVPDDIVVWAAGNRKIDRAAVNEIPGPVNNRCAHYDVEHDFKAWELWAYQPRAEGGGEIDSRIIGFLKYRSELLHKFDPSQRAWPSPRSWEMANRRLAAGMAVEPVVGEDAATEFFAYLGMLAHLPNIDAIAEGRGHRVEFPTEPSLKYATMVELTRRSLAEWDAFANCFRWATTKNDKEPDWTSFFAQDYIRLLRTLKPAESRKILGRMIELPELKKFVADQSTAGGLI